LVVVGTVIVWPVLLTQVYGVGLICSPLL